MVVEKSGEYNVTEKVNSEGESIDSKWQLNNFEYNTKWNCIGYIVRGQQGTIIIERGKKRKEVYEDIWRQWKRKDIKEVIGTKAAGDNSGEWDQWPVGIDS